MTDTETQTLADFLLARIAEDKKWCYRLHVEPVDAANQPGLVSRVLAECQAKRRIVELATGSANEEWHAGYSCGAESGYWTILEVLALPYADHPDYRDEWRP